MSQDGKSVGLALTGAGLSFAGIVGVMTYLGHLTDEKCGTGPWLMVSGSMIGIAVAIYDLIRTVNASEKRSRSGDPK